MRLLTVLCVLLPVCSFLQKHLPDSLGGDTPAISTGLADARTEIAFLDDFSPERVRNLLDGAAPMLTSIARRW